MRSIIFVFLFISLSIQAQTDDGLISYFDFESNFNEQSGNGQNAIFTNTSPVFVCGVEGNAINFNGTSDQMTIFGLTSFFNTRNFTISFYIKPEETLSSQILFSKRENCDKENALGMSFIPNTNTLDILFSENTSKTLTIKHNFSIDDCWQHIVLVREGQVTLLYVNGVLVAEEPAGSRIDLSNTSEILIGGGPCLSPSTIPFKGAMDEFRVYERALDLEEILGLYAAPDKIATIDTLIFLGTDIDVELNNTCSNNFFWSPADGVSNVNIAEPSLAPTETTVYNLTTSVGTCTANDSLRVIVVDPDELDCDNVFLPSAFTPNNDGRNDTYGISNPFALQDLISFEIYDRWGGRVYYTEDKFSKWDGTFKGKEVNPGVFLYRVYYVCKGENNTLTGSVTILR